MSTIKKLKLEELGRIDIATFKNKDKTPLIIVLDNIRSRHNVGAIFRTADAFLIEKVILCGITPQPPHREIHKAALGATESVEWEYANDIQTTIQKLKDLEYQIVGVEQTNNSVPLDEFKINSSEKYVLVLGNEVQGLTSSSLSLYDHFIEIPQLGTKHSLNVSVCGGILLWEFFKKLN